MAERSPGLPAPRWTAATLLCLVSLWPCALGAQGDGTARYSSPLGLAFDYPSGWELHETGRQALLIPPDVPRGRDGHPQEVVVVLIDRLPGVTDVADPQVLDYLDRAASDLTRVGGADRVDSPLGRAVSVDYRGRTQGTAVARRLYAMVQQDLLLVLLHGGSEEIMAGREARARRILQSFRWQAPALDRGLVGTWGRSSTQGSSDASGGVWFTTEESYTFAADGSVVLGSDAAVSASVPGASALGRGDPDAERGRWAAADGSLVILWDDGEVWDLAYSVFSHEGTEALAVRAPGGDGDPTFFRRR